MVAVSVISFCLAVFLIIETIVRKTDFFSPARIYLFFHSAALGIAFIAWDKAMTPFKPLTSLVYFGSGICFLLGIWMVRLLGGSPDNEDSPVRQPLDLKRYNWNVHLFFAFALFFFFVWGMAGAFRGTGMFPVFAKEKLKALHDFMAQRWSYSFALSYAGIAMALFFMAIFRPRRLSKSPSLPLIMTVISVLIFSLALSRSALMFFAFFAIVFYNEAIHRLSIAKLFNFFILCFAIILVSGFFKVNGFVKNSVNIEKPSKILLPMLKVPYMYFANNFWNLDYALNPENYEERHPTTYGFTALEGVLDAMKLPGGTAGGFIREGTKIDDQFNTQAAKRKGWNTIGYQWTLYKDFGLAGVFFGPFLIGLWLAIMYLKVRKQPTLLNVAVYSYIAYFVAISCFGFFSESSTYTYGLFYVCLCCYLSQRTFSEKSHSVVSGLIVGDASAVHPES